MTMLRSCLLVLAFVFATTVAAEDPAKQVPVKDFARKADYDMAKISPNGEYLALSKPHDDTNVIFVISLKDMKMIGGATFVRGQWGAKFWWSGPDRLVVAMARNLGNLDQPKLTGELMGMNADGTQKSYLVGAHGASTLDTRLAKQNQAWAWTGMVDPMPWDPQHVAALMWDYSRLDHDPVLVKLDAYDGSRKQVAVIPAYWPVEVAVDKSGEPRLALGGDRDATTHVMVPGKGGKWLTQAGPDQPRDSELYRLSTDETSAFAALTEKGAPTCLREYLLATDQWKTLACNERVGVGEVAFAPDTRRPIAVTFEDGKPQTVYPDPENPDARLLKALNNSFKGQRVSFTSHTQDGAKWVVFVDGDRNPGDFYLVDRATKKAQYLFSRRNWIDPATMVATEPVRYTTRDGATVDGYLTAQAGLATKSAPLVLMPHGGPFGLRDYWEWNPWVQLLATRGYTVLQVNYRGSGGYGSAHEAVGYGKWGTLMQDDLTDAVKWTIAQGIADPKRVCIFGASYGGYAALRSAEREPDLYRCAISFAGVSDLAGLKSDDVQGGDITLSNYYDRTIGTDAAELKDQSPINHVADLKVPVLLAHGTNDRVVHFSQGTAMRDALKKAGKSVEWMEFDNEEHGFWKDENHEAFLNKVLSFLDQNIGAGRKP